MDTQSDTSHSVFTRVIDAAPEALWQAWTDCEQILRWWAPGDWAPLTCQTHLRVDGGFRLGLRGPGGETQYLAGTYEHVEEPSRLIFAVAPTGPEGDGGGADTGGAGASGTGAGISVHIEPEGGQTRMTVIVEDEGSDGPESLFQGHMEEALDRLEQAVSALQDSAGGGESSATGRGAASRDEVREDAGDEEVPDAGRADEPLDDDRLAAESSEYPPVAGRGIDVALAREGFGGTGLSERVRQDESLEDEGVLDTGLDAEGLDNAGLPDDGLGQDMLEDEFPTTRQLDTLDSGDDQVAAEDMIPHDPITDQVVLDEYLVDATLARGVVEEPVRDPIIDESRADRRTVGDGRLGHEVLEDDQVVLTEDDEYIEDKAVEDQYVGDEYVADAMEDDDPGYVEDETDDEEEDEGRDVV